MKIKKEIGEVYSNFDHKLNEEIATILKNKPNKAWSQHSALNFCGYIWYDGKGWREEIWVYNSLRETLRADTIEDLIEEANSKYGNA